MKRSRTTLGLLSIFVLLGCQIITVELSISTSGSGQVIQYPSAIDVVIGSDVLLTAFPDKGYDFYSWSGDVESKQNPITITMDKDYEIVATFVSQGDVIKYSLSSIWESYSKSNTLLNVKASEKTLTPKTINNFKKNDYFDLDASKAIREKAILIKYKTQQASSTSTESQVFNTFGSKDIKIDATVPFERIIIDKEKYSEIPNMLKYLNSQPNIAFAEEDEIFKALAEPNDEYYSYQWNFKNLNMPAAWDFTTGEEDVIVAVIDSGTYFPLSDLGGTKFAQGFDFVNYLPESV